MNSKWLHSVAWILVMVGGLNWGLVGLGGLMGQMWNLVHMIFGAWPMVEGVVYVLVGLGAVYEIVAHKGICKQCGGMSSPTGPSL